MPTENATTPPSRGPLHDILTAGLPDLRNNAGALSPSKVIRALNISRQAFHKWFKPGRPNRVPPAKIQTIIDLSAAQQNKDAEGFTPITAQMLLPFLATWDREDA